mgnify:FL=1|tara:strand:- start:1975 stop:2625 length:651 start_codon:yes stop_codon:yes gene_type:complete
MKPILITVFALTFSLLAHSQERVKVKISTKYGDMVAELYNETPIHRDNFIKLVKEGFYDGTLFHRVIPGFMIQGGDPASKDDAPNTIIGNGGPGYTLPAEFNPQFFHKKGALAAARMGDAVNLKKESSGSQFYIVEGQVYDNNTIDLFAKRMGVEFSSSQKKAYTTVGGTPHLDSNYTVFGELVEGLEIISKISNVTRDKNNLPKDKVIMNISIVK